MPNAPFAITPRPHGHASVTPLPRVRIVTARFPGVCSATGERYPAGTALVRGPRGWEISQWDVDDTTTCPDGCPSHDSAPAHGDHDAPHTAGGDHGGYSNYDAWAAGEGAPDDYDD